MKDAIFSCTAQRPDLKIPIVALHIIIISLYDIYLQYIIYTVIYVLYNIGACDDS